MATERYWHLTDREVVAWPLLVKRRQFHNLYLKYLGQLDCLGDVLGVGRL
jgi:hypothetical protein